MPRGGGRGGPSRGGSRGGYAGRGGFHSPSKFVSSCSGGNCGSWGDFGYRRRYFDNFVVYPYPYLYYNYAALPVAVAPITNYSIGNPLTYFGSCQAVDGVGVVNNSCSPGLVAIPQAGNTCACYDRTSGVSGCSNVAGATCTPFVPSPYL
jgi:hypothetical protein